jgi:hypothetical protein
MTGDEWNKRTPTRQSIQPTYDSRETGPRYHVTSTVSDRPVAFMKKIDDPFVRHTLHVHWTDLLRGLFRGGLKVEVIVGGDRDIVDDVLELDANTLIGGSSRRAEFDRGIHKALKRMAKEDEVAESDRPGGSA